MSEREAAERCAKIADDEAAEFDRQRIAHNEKGGLPEHGWMIHAKRDEAANIAALIRKSEGIE